MGWPVKGLCIRALSLCLCLVTLALPVDAQDLALPNGARLVVEDTQAQASYALPTGPFAEGQVPSVTVEGQVARQVWHLEGALTNLQIIRPIREALSADGFDILLSCKAEACGGFDFRFGTEVLAPPEMFVDLTNYHFLSARQDTSAVSVLVSTSAAKQFIQIIRVGAANRRAVKPVAIPSAPVIVNDLGAVLEETGRVVLDDLSFETGSSTLSDGPYATLEALGAYLNANPNRSVALVGHTDAVGGLEGNIALSRRRAQAVQKRLARVHKVSTSQMEAGGMGYLSPRTTNLTKEGRASNRRVEAVLTSTQ